MSKVWCACAGRKAGSGVLKPWISGCYFRHKVGSLLRRNRSERALSEESERAAVPAGRREGSPGTGVKGNGNRRGFGRRLPAAEAPE